MNKSRGTLLWRIGRGGEVAKWYSSWVQVFFSTARDES